MEKPIGFPNGKSVGFLEIPFMMRLFSVVPTFALMTSALAGADHLPRLQQKMEGDVLNIWCWNEEFKRYFNAYYPDVESVSKDKTTTTLKNGITVKWTIHSTLDNNYQNQLDKALMAQNRAATDDKVDILGGQNPYACFAETAAAVKVRKAFVYDQGCEEEIQNAFSDYFDGSINLDTAKDLFEKAIKKRYPEITRVVWPQ